MSKRSEKAFEDIGEELDKKTSAVGCSIAEYLEGLHDIRDRIDAAIEAAESDLAALQRHADKKDVERM